MEWLTNLKIFYLLGAVNALFFSVLVFSKKQKTLADKLLGIWLVVLAVQVVYPYFYLSNLDKYMSLMGYEAGISVLQPAGLFFYTKAMVGKLKWDNSTKVLLVALIVSVASIFGFMSYMPDERVRLIMEPDFFKFLDFKGQILSIIFFGLFLYLYVYLLIKSSLLLKKYKQNIKNVYSNREKVDLQWLQKLIYFFYASYGVLFIAGVIFYLAGLSMAFADYTYYALMVVFIFMLGFWGHQQGKVFNMSEGLERKNNKKALDKVKINEESFPEEANALNELMDNDKPYLNPVLTVHELADMLGMPSHQLSKLIHKEFKKNFYEFVNYYRIEYFKKQIVNKKYKGFTILAVAFDCGFNSKSAFNRIFKEQTGLTPRQYKLSQEEKEFAVNKT